MSLEGLLSRGQSGPPFPTGASPLFFPAPTALAKIKVLY